LILSMKDNNKYFEKALGDFAFEAACGAAIRHLNELGYSAGEIAKRLDFPISEQRVRQALKKYEQDKLTGHGPDGEYEIIKEFDEYGKSSYRRVKRSDAES